MLFAPPFGLLAPGRAGSKDIRTRGLNYFTGKFPESQVFFENKREFVHCAKRPRLPLWGSWHGEAVTEEAFPAATGNSPCHCVALPPHKCGGKACRSAVSLIRGIPTPFKRTGPEWAVAGTALSAAPCGRPFEPSAFNCLTRGGRAPDGTCLPPRCRRSRRDLRSIPAPSRARWCGNGS